MRLSVLFPAAFAAALLFVPAVQATLPPSGAAACPVEAPADVGALAAGAVFDPTQPGASVPSARLGDPDPAAESRKRADEHALFERILADRGAVPASAPLDAAPDAAQRASIGTDPGRGRLKVGVSVAIGSKVDFSSFSGVSRSPGAVGPGYAAALADGGAVWEAAIASSGAKALRIHLTGLALAEGVSLYVYNESGQVQGPYTGSGPDGSGELWTGSVFGDAVRIHVRAPSKAALAVSRFTIADAVHLGPLYSIADTQRQAYETGPSPDGTNFCGVTVPACTVNGVCAIDTNPGLTNASNAVAQIDFMDGGSAYICSGTLINPSGSVRTPYFLTANHCFSTQASATTLQAHFHFRTMTCATCTTDQVIQVNGSTLMATGALPAKSDFTLVRFNSLPAGLVLLGWSAAHPVEGAYVIHLGHPGGSPLAYSLRRIRYTPSALPQCSDLARPTFLYSGVSSTTSDAQGAIAGGSSGGSAILLNDNATDAYIVGQLLGDCYSGTTPNECDANQTATVDGALQYSFPYLQPYLYDRIFSNGFDG